MERTLITPSDDLRSARLVFAGAGLLAAMLSEYLSLAPLRRSKDRR
jgi:hypothetical protein